MKRGIGTAMALLLVLGWAELAPARSVIVNNIPFTYQTRLAPGRVYTFKFRLYDAATGGRNLWEEPNVRLRVKDDRTIEWNLGRRRVFRSTVDFSKQLWVQVYVGSTALTPRAKLWVAPYALWSRETEGAKRRLVVTGIPGQRQDLQQWRSSAGAVLAGVDASGNLRGASLNAQGGVSAASVSASGQVSAASFSGDGSQLTNLDPGKIQPSTKSDDLLATNSAGTGVEWVSPNARFFRVGGNDDDGQDPHILGFGGDAPLELMVCGERALRLEYVPDFLATNVIGGHAENNVTPGKIGAFIGGGGNDGFPNHVGANFSLVCGGLNNQVTDTESAIVGGTYNTVSGYDSFIGGGDGNLVSGGEAVVVGGSGNTASGDYSMVLGGSNNVAMGTNSFASGASGKAWTEGSFVWADNSTGATFPPPVTGDPNTPVADVGSNQFWVQATGGVFFVTGYDGLGNPTGVKLGPGDTSWSAFTPTYFTMSVPAAPGTGRDADALASLQATVEAQGAQIRAQREEIEALRNLISGLQMQHAQLRSLLGAGAPGGPHAALERP